MALARIFDKLLSFQLVTSFAEQFVDFVQITTTISICFYLVASLLMAAKLFDSKGPNYPLVLLCACIAIVPHTLISNMHIIDGSNINFSLPNVITLVSLIISLTLTAIALKYKVNLLLPVVYCFAATWLLITLFLPEIALKPLAINSPVIITHITMSLVAYCVLLIGCLYSFQVTYINVKLKSKNLAAVNHLPPLMLVEKQLFMILALGTACLLITEVSGFIFLDSLFSKANAHKTFLSLAALALYCVILWGHYKQGWRGHRVLTLTIIATALLTLAYFGSRFVKEFLLS